MRPSKILNRLFTAFAVVAITAPSLALADNPRSDESGDGITVEAQPLATALQAFSEQSGLQIAYVATLADNVSSKGTEGADTPVAALSEILESTGLEYQFVNNDTVAIGPGLSDAGSGDSGNSRPPSSQVIMAQNQAPAEEKRSATKSEDDEEDSLEHDKIVVTGTNIRGVDTSAPSITIDRLDLDRTGYSSIEEVFQRLPQNFTDINASSRLSPNIGTPLSNANFSRAEGVNLRGLGANSTLILLDGKRRAGSIGGRVVDVSVLPISLVERIEIVFGGRSAIYGSDAVGGVVNFVTRKDYEGAETRAFFRTTENGGQRFQTSQLLGIDGDAGSVVAAYDYSEDWDYNLVDVGLAQPVVRFLDTLTPIVIQAQAPSRRHAAYASGELSVTDVLEIYASGLYSNRSINSFSSVQSSLVSEPDTEQVRNSSEQYSITGGVRTALFSEWAMDTSGTLSRVSENRDGIRFDNFTFGSFTETSELDQQSDILSFSALADGPLFTIAGITPKAAFGIEARSETLERVVFTNMIETTPFEKQSRSIQSAFLEIYVPIMQGSQSLDISLAGRFDRYSDFGDTFNPHFGVIYSPIPGLTIKGSFSESFRAPDLINLGANSTILILPLADPQSGAGFSNTLLWTGDAPGLRAENAKTWSVSSAYQPEFAPWLSLSAAYFAVDYDDRIERPFPTFLDINNAFFNSDIFVDQIDRTPGSARIDEILESAVIPGFFNATGIPWDPATQDLLDVFPNIVVLDARTSNVASEKIRGIDFSVLGDFATEIGDIFIGASGTYVLTHDRKITQNSPSLSRLNDIGKPVDFKLQGQARWSRKAYSFNAIVNYTDGYRNSFVPDASVDAFTTVDISTSVNVGELWQGPVSNGLLFTFNVNNVFDSQPPRFDGNTNPTIYDQINASPFGRMYSLRLVKNW